MLVIELVGRRQVDLPVGGGDGRHIRREDGRDEGLGKTADDLWRMVMGKDWRS